MILTNAVVIAVVAVLVLSMARVNVVVALTAGALIGGVVDGYSFSKSLEIFSSGLGGGAEIALSYAILGAFAAAVAHSGVPIWLSQKITKFISNHAHNAYQHTLFKVLIIILLGTVAIMSKNVLPVHIAFIPILIPPLLGIFAELKMDRRLISNVLTFGLIFTYMIIPYGFGGIFLEGIVRKNLLQSGLDVTLSEVLLGSLFPALGMVVGLTTSMCCYWKPRSYDVSSIQSIKVKSETCTVRDIIVSGVAILCTLVVQLMLHNTIASAMAGFFVFTIGGVVHWRDSDDVVTQGFKMVSLIAFIMIAAAGFSAVLRATHDIQSLVVWLSSVVGASKFLSALGMLIVGLLITLGIGSSFSTVPIITGIYVPLCMQLGFSPLATICIVIAAAVTGDAGSPASDTMLGATAGLNVDGQHNHIFDTCVPAFLHFNVPVIIFGLLGAMLL